MVNQERFKKKTSRKEILNEKGVKCQIYQEMDSDVKKWSEIRMKEEEIKSRFKAKTQKKKKGKNQGAGKK